MSSRKQSDAPEDFTSSGAHVQTPGGADIVPSKTTFDFNSSLIVADLNSSVFDGKKQLELSSILAQQEKLLLEKNYEHKEILEDYKHLKEQFIMKDTETSRLKRLLQEQKE